MISPLGESGEYIQPLQCFGILRYPLLSCLTWNRRNYNWQTTWGLLETGKRDMGPQGNGFMSDANLSRRPVLPLAVWKIGYLASNIATTRNASNQPYPTRESNLHPSYRAQPDPLPTWRGKLAAQPCSPASSNAYAGNPSET